MNRTRALNVCRRDLEHARAHAHPCIYTEDTEVFEYHWFLVILYLCCRDLINISWYRYNRRILNDKTFIKSIGLNDVIKQRLKTIEIYSSTCKSALFEKKIYNINILSLRTRKQVLSVIIISTEEILKHLGIFVNCMLRQSKVVLVE